jgi:uncharacterized spore protein YtfJ
MAMNIHQVIQQAQDSITVRRVFGEPYEKDGITVIPAAKVGGAGGGGGGEGPEGSGSGGGFGLGGSPAGAYVITDGTVRWQPALDLNRVILGAQVLVLVGLLTLHTAIRARGRR